jgi:TolB-like protein
MRFRSNPVGSNFQLKEIQSIAVLSFVSTDPNTEYLGNGITEGLINHLSQIPGLKVMAHETVLHRK